MGSQADLNLRWSKLGLRFVHGLPERGQRASDDSGNAEDDLSSLPQYTGGHSVFLELIRPETVWPHTPSVSIRNLSFC